MPRRTEGLPEEWRRRVFNKVQVLLLLFRTLSLVLLELRAAIIAETMHLEMLQD